MKAVIMHNIPTGGQMSDVLVEPVSTGTAAELEADLTWLELDWSHRPEVVGVIVPEIDPHDLAEMLQVCGWRTLHRAHAERVS